MKEEFTLQGQGNNYPENIEKVELLEILKNLKSQLSEKAIKEIEFLEDNSFLYKTFLENDFGLKKGLKLIFGEKELIMNFDFRNQFLFISLKKEDQLIFDISYKRKEKEFFDFLKK
jgi:hypothetical protein